MDAGDVICALVEIGGDVLATPGQRRCNDRDWDNEASSPV
jgi:hypothetical protein